MSVVGVVGVGVIVVVVRVAGVVVAVVRTNSRRGSVTRKYAWVVAIGSSVVAVVRVAAVVVGVVVERVARYNCGVTGVCVARVVVRANVSGVTSYGVTAVDGVGVVVDVYIDAGSNRIK